MIYLLHLLKEFAHWIGEKHLFCGELIWALMKQNIAVITILKDLQEYKLMLCLNTWQKVAEGLR